MPGKGPIALTVGGRQADLIRRLRNGEESLEDWELEELIRGYRKDKNGKWSGRRPNVVPREVHDELAKRVKSEVAHDLRALVATRVVPILDKITDPYGLDPADVPGLRLQAQVVQDLLDRFVVTKQEKLEITGTMRHEQVIANVTVDRSLPEPGEDEDVVEAEIVDEDEWEDEEDEDEFIFD